MLHMTKTITPPTKPPRVSVPVTPEVAVVFQRLAKAGNMSTGRAMAEWLSDTVEAAQFMAEKMEQARAAPKAVMAEIHAYALGLADDFGSVESVARDVIKAKEIVDFTPHEGLADRLAGKFGVVMAKILNPSAQSGMQLR